MFEKLKHNLLNPPKDWEIQQYKYPDYYEYVGNTKVGAYHVLDCFYAGAWLQTTDHVIRVYSRGTHPQMPYKKLQFIYFNEDKMEGPVHRHDMIEIGYVVYGCSKQTFSNKEYLFKKGDFWITDCNCYHSDSVFLGDLFTVYVSVPRKLFDHSFFKSVDDSEIQHFIYTTLLEQKKMKQFLHFTPRKKDDKAARLFQEIVEEIDTMEIGYQDISRGLISRLLSKLTLEYDAFLTNQQKNKMNQLLFREIELYIQTHYQTVTIQQLVKKFHYNEDFYNRLIKENTGLTYSSYLQQIKLTKAEILLTTTKYSIEEISQQVGYQNRSYFYRVFTRKYGVTPAQYRKNNSRTT